MAFLKAAQRPASRLFLLLFVRRYQSQLADVIVYPDGFVKVVDLDELVTARRSEILSENMLDAALLRLDHLLKIIYNGHFSKLQKPTEHYY